MLALSVAIDATSNTSSCVQSALSEVVRKQKHPVVHGGSLPRPTDNLCHLADTAPWATSVDSASHITLFVVRRSPGDIDVGLT